MEQLKRTALFPRYGEHGAKTVDYAGWEMPVEFSGLVKEHEAVREAAGLFDVSHMGEIEITGKEAEAYLQNLLSNNIKAMVDEQIFYTMMCYPDGGVVDDLLVYRRSAESYLLVVNASNKDKDYQWMLDAKGSFQVSIDDRSEQTSEVALQGPKAEQILQKLTDTDLSTITFFTFKESVKIAGVECLVSRTGYTGEDGFEVYTDHEGVLKVWDAIMDAGKEEGVRPIGLGARDTLRFEASLPLYGNEISQDITPLEAGLGMFVKLDGEDFIGRDALVRQKEEGLQRKIIGFELIENGIPRHGYEVLDGEQVIGVVTTGYFSPTLGKSIGMALVDVAYSEMDRELLIRIRKRLVKAKVVSKRFYVKKYKK